MTLAFKHEDVEKSQSACEQLAENFAMIAADERENFKKKEAFQLDQNTYQKITSTIQMNSSRIETLGPLHVASSRSPQPTDRYLAMNKKGPRPVLSSKKQKTKGKIEASKRYFGFAVSSIALKLLVILVGWVSCKYWGMATN